MKVDNRWDPTLAPRAVSTAGGIYRDVGWWWPPMRCNAPGRWGVTTRAWLIGNRRFRSRPGAQHRARRAQRHRRETADRRRSARGPPAGNAAAHRASAKLGGSAQRSEVLRQVALWSPETPTFSTACAPRSKWADPVRDVVETSFGFRWVQWTADKGFFLNGQHRYFRGANAHQDQVGVMPSPMPPSTATCSR